MRSLKPDRRSFGAAVLVAASLAYPGLVYAGRDWVPPLAFVAAALTLLALRFATLRTEEARLWRTLLAVAAFTVALIAVLDAGLAVKVYPVALSLAAAAVFGLSLRHPPSVIERIARRMEPDLPPEGQLYCRKVTLVWTVWFVINALVASTLALAGRDELWALWTGLLAYAVMGLLFGGEMIVRRRARRPAVA